jgi:hypothetical protein
MNSIALSANAPTMGRARQEDFSGFAFNIEAQAAAGARKKMHHSNAAANFRQLDLHIPVGPDAGEGRAAEPADRNVGEQQRRCTEIESEHRREADVTV